MNMDYLMLICGGLLMLTVSLGNVSGGILNKVIFRLIPLISSATMIINALNNLNVI